MYDGHQVCLRQRTVIIQTPVERFQIFPFQTQSRRHGMSSESQKQIPAPGQSFIHIIGFDGPARGFNHTFCFRAHDHRTVVFFLQTARNNTNQTFVAVLQTEDDDFVVLHFALLDHFYRPLIAENRHLLPALIQIDQFRRQMLCFLPVLRLQKPGRHLRRTQPSRRIKTWSDHKAHMICGNIVFIQTTVTDQRLKTRMGYYCQPVQTIFHNDPVFIHQVHHISHRRNGGKGQQFIKFRLRHTTGLIELFHQLKSHSGAAQPLKRVGAVFPFRINDRIRIRQLINFLFISIGIRLTPVDNLMMIRNDHCHSKFLCHSHRIHGGNPIITGQNTSGAPAVSLPDNALIQPVAFLNPVRRRHVSPASGLTDTAP